MREFSAGCGQCGGVVGGAQGGVDAIISKCRLHHVFAFVNWKGLVCVWISLVPVNVGSIFVKVKYDMSVFDGEFNIRNCHTGRKKITRLQP